MTGTAVECKSVGPAAESPASAASDEQLIAMLVGRARSEGLQLTGEGGLLQQLTKRVLESALEGEITEIQPMRSGPCCSYYQTGTLE